MKSVSVSIDHPLMWVTISLLGGLAYAYFLYAKSQNPWSSSTNLILAVLRGVVVSGLIFLLSNILIKTVWQQLRAPLVVLAVDNSKSITLIQTDNKKTFKNQLSKNLLNTKSQLESKGYRVLFTDLGNQESDQPNIGFEARETNISHMIEGLQDQYNERGLAAIGLISDGIYNAGTSPELHHYLRPIYPLALGDTIPKTDIAIQNIVYNKVVFQGNKFPVNVSLNVHAIKSPFLEVSLWHQNKKLKEQTVKVDPHQNYYEAKFLPETKKSGFQRYEIRVKPQDDEFETSNNQQNFFVEVIEGKQKITLVSSGPHPDIKALRQALEASDNYELEVLLPYQYQSKKTLTTDLLVIYDLPSRGLSLPAVVQKSINQGTPILWILGSQTDYNQWNNLNGLFRINQKRFQDDNVSPLVDSDFNLFSVEPNEKRLFDTFLPITVPYAEYMGQKNHHVFLFQQISGIQINKPLVAFGTHRQAKVGIMFGQGFWMWRMQEYSETEKTGVFDNVFRKMIQYLASKDNKSQFKLYPVKETLLTTEDIVFRAEFYNALFEPLQNQTVKLTVTPEDKTKSASYSFNAVSSGTQLKIGFLTPGVYNYNARTIINDKPHTVTGQFVVVDFQKEAMTLTADHRLLKVVAERSGGRFFKYNQVDQWAQHLVDLDLKGTIESRKDWKTIIENPWLFFLLMVLISIEWIVRRYNGVI